MLVKPGSRRVGQSIHDLTACHAGLAFDTRLGHTAPVGELAITVVGQDRPGIVADVSGVLAGRGLNLTDSTMTLLRGHFAMTLICVGEPDAAAVQAALEALTADGNLVATVRATPPGAGAGDTGTPHTLIVHGADRLGIVAAVTRVLADTGGNVTDLTTRLSGTLYLLSAEVDLPSTVDPDELVAQLDEVAEQLGVEVSLRTAEADVL
jgi:glycine cleavage system transcriptional repressor